ncbi:MAG: hypothetical protein IMZ67_01835, partial [Acidobacteria bacterium]|nr:hypothetical protein [Acidobacteriota bacterium]
ALAVDFPRLWRDPKTPPRERKRMIRLLIEDVTLNRADTITAHVRFRGGSTRTLTLPIPLRAWELKKTNPAVMAEVDTLLESHTPGCIATMLNQHGHRSGDGRPFTRKMVVDLVKDAHSGQLERGFRRIVNAQSGDGEHASERSDGCRVSGVDPSLGAGLIVVPSG